VIRPDLTSLRIFLAVYSVGNITKAAEREHIAPSAVSKRIQDLEAELGAALFYRHARGVTATPAGEVLAGHAASLFEGVDRMAADLSLYTDGVRGHVRIQAHSSAVIQYLPQEIAAFAGLYPGIRVILREDKTPGVLQSMLDGVADIGIFDGSSIPAPPGLKCLSYRRDHLAAVFPIDHPCAALPYISFIELKDMHHISLSAGSAIPVLLARVSESLGFSLNTRIEVSTFDAAIRMAEAGLGVAIAPHGVVTADAGSGRVAAVALTDPWAHRRLQICVRDEQKLTASARIMLRHLRRGASEGEAGADEPPGSEAAQTLAYPAASM
jgi:DNA-binding transcriptional LysR family regulator